MSFEEELRAGINGIRAEYALAEQEKRILNDANVGNAIAYCREVLKRPWPDLEERLLREHVDGEVMGDYARECRGGDWPDAERLLLSWVTNHSFMAVDYAVAVGKSQWQELEDRLLTDEEWDDPSTRLKYATGVRRGDWPEAEHSTQYLCEYAREVVRGRLPEHLHTTMVMSGFKNLNDQSVKDYLKFVAQQP